MPVSSWWLPAMAAAGISAAAIGLYVGRDARETSQPAAVAAPLQTIQSKDRLALDPRQQEEARRSGAWLSDVRSLLRVDRPMRYGQFVWNDKGVPPGDIWIRVDLRTQLMSVFRGGHEIGTAVVLYGADEKETPLGTFPILWKKKDHVSSLYDAPMPYTLRLTNDGVAIHGSDVRWGAATHGCVGVPKEFASHLFAVADVGDKVLIVRTAAPSSKKA